MELFPMNAKPLKGKTKERVLASGNYIAEIKWNGYRQLCIGGELLSRGIGIDGKQKSKTAWVPHITETLSELGDYWFDGELLKYPAGTARDVTKIMQSSVELALEKQRESGNLTYMIFDLLHTPEDGWIGNLPWVQRRSKLSKVYFERLKNHEWIRLSKVYANIDTPLKLSKDSGLEGIMLKNMHGKWIPGTATTDSRPANNWYKIKHELNEPEDVVITGFVPPEMHYKDPSGKKDESRLTKYYVNNWIGGVKIGQYVNGSIVDVGSFSGITDEIRKDMSEHPDNYVNRVCMIKAFDRNETGRFVNPVFVGFRDDKRPEECVWIEGE